jgi:hypothetical protein
LTGSGTLNVTVDNIRAYFSGNWSGFDGLINVSPRSGTGDFRINNANGYASAAIFLNSGVNFYNVNANGQTTDIGELGGASGAFIGAGNGGSINPTWRIGAKNTTNTYAGAIADAGVTALIRRWNHRRPGDGPGRGHVCTGQSIWHADPQQQSLAQCRKHNFGASTAFSPDKQRGANSWCIFRQWHAGCDGHWRRNFDER